MVGRSAPGRRVGPRRVRLRQRWRPVRVSRGVLVDLPLGVVALGLVHGALYALNSLGLVVLWRVTRVVNLAQSALGLVGGVFTGMLVTSAGWSFWWAAPVGIATGVLLGMATDRLVLVRLQDAPRVVLLVATVGLAQIFTAFYILLPFVFGGRLPSYSIELGFSLDISPVLLGGPHILAVMTLPVATLATWWFLRRSRLGIAGVALGQDVERARALGVPAGLVRAVAWGVAGGLGSISGVLSIPIIGFTLGETIGITVLLLALAPAVVAGLRDLWLAVVASLVVGVVYQACLWWAPTSGVADIALALIVVAALATQRRRLGRTESALRSTSWSAATTPRPLAWSVTTTAGFKVLAVAVAVAVAGAAAAVPVLLRPSQDVLYATTVGLALGALAIAIAWMFAGEIPLGHWGFAGMGAAATAVTPGPWVFRALVAVILTTAIAAVLAFASRGRSGLAFAVLGLGVAVAAPPVLLRFGRGTVPTDPGVVGAIGGAVLVGLCVGVILLRSSTLGARMVAARDEPDRAPWLGADPGRHRVLALSLSGAVAGLAGALYLASTPAGIAPGAFDPPRSLDVLAMAVVGGLGAPVGAVLGVVSVQAGKLLLPGAWALLASGVGVLVVVLFVPAGLGRITQWLRDAAVRVVLRHRPEPGPGLDVGLPAPTASIVTAAGRIAGSDTREAWRTPTVRAVALAAVAAGGIGIAAALGAPGAWRASLRLPDAAAPWVIIAGLGLFLAVAVVAWRVTLPDDKPHGSAVVVTAATIALGIYIAVSDDAVMGALALPLVSGFAGWTVGRCARMAAAASVPDVTSAASGVVSLMAMVGILPALHLLSVGSGSGLPSAAGWASAYATLAGVMTLRAGQRLAADRRRVAGRATAEVVDVTAAAGATALHVDQLAVTFGSTPVIRSASFAVEAGELLALVGANGAGKSTLLRAVAGVLVPEAGHVIVAGEDVTGLRPEERASAGIAFVSGARPVFPDLTVQENLRVAAFTTHRTASAFASAADAVLEFVPALRDRPHAKAGVLSGGEQRILALAQTLFRMPTVLLADELTLGLDVESRAAVLDLLRLLADQGVAVVAVDHDLPELIARSDRAVLLADGVIEEFRKPRELLVKRKDLLPATFLIAATTKRTRTPATAGTAS